MIRRYGFLILLLLFTGLCHSFSQNLKKSYINNAYRNPIHRLDNGKITLFIEDVTGKFYLKSLDGKNILYYDSTRTDFFTSHLNIKIDDSLYSNEAALAKKLPIKTMTGAVTIDTNYAITQYKIRNGKITVEQKLSPVNYFGLGALIAEVTITNTDNSPHSAGALYEFDIQVNKNDGVNFRSDMGKIAGDTALYGNSVPYLWRAYEKENSDTNFLVQNILKGDISYINISGKKEYKKLIAPGSVIFDEWEKLYNVLWEYSDGTEKAFFDGAVILRWDEVQIPPNSSVTFITFIGIAKGSLSGGNLILNSYTTEELYYNGNRYAPDPLNHYTLIYNNGSNEVKNLSAEILLPYGLYSDSTEKFAAPSNLLPFGVSSVQYQLHPKMSALSRTSVVNLTVTSSIGKSAINSLIKLPAAPDADTLDPVVTITKKGCEFVLKATETQANDKGIDSVQILSAVNMIYNYIKPGKGDTILFISGSLSDGSKPANLHIRIFDRAGNVSDRTIKLEPDIIGFENESIGSGNMVFIPFKIKTKDEQRTDSIITCVVKYDKGFLLPAANPVVIPAGQKNNSSLSNVKVTDNEIEFTLKNRTGFDLKTIALLQFNALSGVAGSTDLIIDKLVINNNTDYCTYKSSGKISFNSTDKSTPKINLSQFGSRFTGSVTDNLPDDKGIYNVYLSQSSNAVLISENYEPGAQKINITISAIDSSLGMNGNLAVIDGSGNFSSYFFQLEPVLIKLDSVKATSNENVTISPVIYGELPDITLREYSFGVSFDTTILSLRAPYYDKSGTSGTDYTVIIDTTSKGKIRISGYGSSFLTLGKVLNLLFSMKVGKDTSAPVKFDYFYLKNGLKPVHTKDGMVIRKNNDLTAPVINYYQQRREFFVKVTENSFNDLGIDSANIINLKNFESSVAFNSNREKSFRLFVIDSTKQADCKIYARDLIGNPSQKDISFIPVNFILPDTLKSINDSLTLNVWLRTPEPVMVGSFDFSLHFDQNFFNTPDSLNFYSNDTIKSSYRFDSLTSTLNIKSLSASKTVAYNIKLFDFKLGVKRNNISSAEFYFTNITVSNDSLFGYGGRTVCLKPVTDTAKPVIDLKKHQCEYHATIKDLGGIDSIWLGEKTNLIDTIKYSVPFKKYDTLVRIKLLPLNFKNVSKLVLFAKDSMGNISVAADSLFPIFVSLPAKTKIEPDSTTEIPLFIKGNNNIGKIELLIKYDSRLVLPDAQPVSTKGTLLENSTVIFDKTGTDKILITASPVHNKTDLPLFYLKLKGMNGDSLTTNLNIERLSINNDSTCSYYQSGIIYRSKLNEFTVSIEPLSTGKIGKEISIPINITGEFGNYNFTKIELQLSFNPTILKPLGITSNGTLLEKFTGAMNYDISGKLFLSYTGNDIMPGNLPLTNIAAKVLLGNSDSTIIKIDTIKIEYSNSIAAPVIKLENGLFVLTGRYEWQQGLKLKTDYLYQNQPNPYNSSTIIRFTISSRSKTTLIIYDILGREILKPVDDFLDEGLHSFNFNSKNLPSGVYYYMLKTENYSQTRKMVLLK